VRDRIDEKRVHFLGKVPYPTFLNALQVSSAHIYLTYPFVLSWSILEAMSAGCVVIGSDTAPVREVVQQGENALLVPFLEPQALAEQTIEVLRSPNKFVSMRETARQYVVENFDASRVCVPKVRRLLTNEQPEPPVRRFWPGQASQKKESDSVANKRAARRAPIGRQQSAKSRRPARKPSR
jgi:glycosyltransferase involved in cell wall biosynthesis